MSVFQPQLQSQITPAQEVVASNKGTLATVQQVGAIATEQMAKHSLGKLQSEFEAISQARMQGGDSSSLQSRARVSLNKFKASAPALATHADKMFSSSFGGGSSGAFELSPEEKAAAKVRQDVTEYSLQNGVSMRVAQERLALNDAAVASQSQATLDKNDATRAGQSTEQAHQLALTSASTNLFDMLSKDAGNDGLDANSLQSYKLGIDRTANEMRARIRANAFTEGGVLAIPRDVLDSRMKEVDAWVTRSNNIVDDADGIALASQRVKEINTSNVLQITESMPLITAAASISPQLGDSMFQYMTTGNDVQRQHLLKTVPGLATLAEDPVAFTRTRFSATNKVFTPSASREPLTPQEASVFVSDINNPQAAPVYSHAIDQMIFDDAGSRRMREVTSKAPEGGALLYSSVMKQKFREHGEKADEAYEAGVLGQISSFHSSYLTAHGKLPKSVNVIKEIGENGKETWRLDTPESSAFDPTLGMVANNLLKGLYANPEYLERKNAALGLQLTPEEYVSSVLSLGSLDIAPQTQEIEVQRAAAPAPTKPSGKDSVFQPAPQILPGQEIDGYTFKGGDPSKEENWEQVDGS